MKKSMILVLTILFMSQLLFAQGPIDKDEKKPTNYIDLNSELTNISEIHEPKISFKYHDYFGETEGLRINVFNSKHEVKHVYQLSKSYGLNYYNINLKQLFNDWKIDEVYSFEFTNERKEKYTLKIRKSPLPKLDLPEVSITVDPINFSCEAVNENLIDFYGSVTGGKPPYKVTWYVLDKDNIRFLYQPREVVTESALQMTSIRVDRDPNYNVVINVLDACGKENQQMVQIVCEKKKKRINTLFLDEKLNAIPTNYEPKN